MGKLSSTNGAEKRASPAEIETAIKRIVNFHKLGQLSLAEYPGRMEYGHHASEARKRMVTDEMLRKARAFADPERGYTQSALQDLCETMRREKSAFGIPMLVHLLPLKKQNRKTIQCAALKERWSNQRLLAEIRSRYRKNDGRGRTFTEPENAAIACQMLLQLSEKWHKYYRQLIDQEEIDGAVPVLKELTETARRAVGDADVAIAKAIKLLKRRFPPRQG